MTVTTGFGTRSPRPVPSGATYTPAVLPFAPTRETLDAVIAYLDEHGAEAGGVPDDALRREAFARYEDLPAPGARPSRSWRYDYDKLDYDELGWTSSRAALASMPPRLPGSQAISRADDADAEIEIDRPALATDNAGGLFHVGGTYFDAGEPGRSDPRVTVLPLADAYRAHAETLDGTANAIVDWRTDRFAALATAFQNCGAFVYVPDGVQLDRPIQLIFGSSEADAQAVFPHVVVALGKGARATVLERHVGDGDPFVCGRVEVALGEAAQLDYAVVQQAGEDARIFMSRDARCERGAQIRWHLAELGAALARTVIGARLVAPEARAQTAALFFNTGMQHVDLVSGVDHVVGPTESDTVVRSAATDRGQGRYVGNIVIRPKAHGSDASLRDDALLLSKRAHIDSIPALEIAANDVKAFHGATVGSLDEDALFYLGSRGIARNEALRLITLGFFEPVIARFPSEALRDEIRTALDRKIDDATEIGT